VVALALGRSEQLVVALLGVLLAGAAYLPIDPRYPHARLRHLLDDADPELLLTESATAEAIPERQFPRILLDRPDLDPPAGRPDLRPVTPENLAYVMYTSGSTGLPKSVAITHANIVNGVTGLRRRRRDPSG
jgi:non-ribosomal peptide synthetase component F